MKSLRTWEEQQLKEHQARLQLVSFAELVAPIIVKAKPISNDDFKILLESARVSPDYQDSILLNDLVIKLGVELYN
jgi:hypothetical protein